MKKDEKPLFLIGTLPKNNAVLEALVTAKELLGSVAFVSQPGDTRKALRLIDRAIKDMAKTGQQP